VLGYIKGQSAMSKLSAPHFTDEDAARKHLEAIRWPCGPVCPHCGSVKKPYTTKREGKYRCSEKECRKDFTVKVGTVFEASHIPLHKWLLAAYLLCSSKKGMSSHQLHRTLEVTYKTAWFMTHRIREAMRTGTFSPLGGTGKVVEADETYIGRKDGTVKARGGYHHKRAVLSLVERGGEVRSFHVDRAIVRDVVPIVRKNVRRESILATDESNLYTKLGKEFAEHVAVEHGIGEYVRDEAHTNTIEGFFSIFKRGFKGIYQHCGEQHLHRYLAEDDFRYNNRSRFGIEDARRADIALAGIEGKRLTYRRVNG
jgi:transposase-like protein